jgi:GNAT superfamily N-acetyltransferase
MRIDPLSDIHDRVAFDSGVEPLDRYLRTQVGQDIRRRVASCFVLTEDDVTPLGFYTLAATSIALSDLPAAAAKRLPRYPIVPATLMGRLAVDRRARGRRLGELLLMDAFSRTLRSEIASYAIVVDAKDESAESFYKVYQFLPLAASGRRLFIPMAEVAKLFT